MGRSAEDCDALEAMFALVPVAPPEIVALRARMADPARHYHGLGHLALLWRRHASLGAGSPLTRSPWHRLVACAIAYHDAIYDPTRRDNEARSADLWRAALPTLPPIEIDWVAGTILATADHLGAMPDPAMSLEAWAARLWVLDLDLTPIGEAPAGFMANTAALRAEFAHLQEAAWEAGRIGFLRSLAERPAIYRSPAIAAAFDRPARANLARELAAAG